MYRIVEETKRSGEKKYYVQTRFLWIFWKYLRQIYDISMYEYRVAFDNMEAAEAMIQSMEADRQQRQQEKIVRRKIIMEY